METIKFYLGIHGVKKGCSLRQLGLRVPAMCGRDMIVLG